jgi:cytochrome c oxidase assembly protein subunit 15
VWLFLGLTVLALVTIQRKGAPARVMHQGELLIAAIVGQGALGYLQYFSGVPSGLVALHIAMATVVWAATVAFTLSLFERPAAAVDPAPAGDRATSPATNPLLAHG